MRECRWHHEFFETWKNCIIIKSIEQERVFLHAVHDESLARSTESTQNLCIYCISCNSQERNWNVFNIAMTPNASTASHFHCTEKVFLYGPYYKEDVVSVPFGHLVVSGQHSLLFHFLVCYSPWAMDMVEFLHVFHCGTDCVAPFVATDGTTETDGMKWTRRW